MSNTIPVHQQVRRNELRARRKQSRWLAQEFAQIIIEEWRPCQENENLHQVIEGQLWLDFLELSKSQIKMNWQCIAPLARVAESWSMEKIQHYGWASMGQRYCKLLATVALQHPNWREAAFELNQVLLRRIFSGRSIRTTVNPLCIVDLEQVAGPSRDHFPIRTDMPPQYKFDEFGLITAKFSSSQLAKAESTTVISDVDLKMRSRGANGTLRWCYTTLYNVILVLACCWLISYYWSFLWKFIRSVGLPSENRQ